MFKKILPIAIVLVVLLFVFIPAVDVFAQSFPGGPDGLVPCGDKIDSEGNVTNPCEACHLTVLAQNIINFMVYFAIFVATLMFVYAGFTYVTAGSNVEKIKKAHDVFLRVFIGIIIVLSAWLVVDLIMKTFLDEGETAFGPWNKIECIRYVNTGNNPGNPNAPGYFNYNTGGGPEGPSPSDDIIVVSPPTLEGPDTRTQVEKDTNEQMARNDLLVEGEIRVNKGWCAVNERYQDHVNGCTDLSLITADTMQGIKDLQEGCNCLIVVTGGSELGHTGTGPGTHEGGDKYDISTSPAINAYIFGNDFTDGRDPGGRPAKINNTTGDIFVNEGSHWDVLVKQENGDGGSGGGGF